MSTVEILKEARAKIAKGWTRGWFAADSHNRPCEPRNPDACRWCSMGAIYACATQNESGIDAAMAIRASLPDGTYSIAVWNDAQGSAFPVLELFDKTIARLENAE